MSSAGTEGLRGRIGTPCLLALLTLGSLAYLNCFSTAIYRISPADESTYLLNGLRFDFAQFENYELFPLHSFWYSLLHTFIADPIDLYKQGAVIQFTLLVLLVVWVSYALSRHALAAFALGLALVATPVLGVSASPFAQRSALIVVLVGVWVASRLRTPARRAVAMGVAFFLAAFARSEYILSFYFSSVGLVGWVLLRDRTKEGFRTLGTYAAVILGLSLLLDFPLLTGSHRSFMAFGQHYAVQLEAQGAELDPWLHWEDAVSDTFGEADSIQAALIENPAAFAGHVRWSAGGLYRWTRRLHPVSLALLAGCLVATAVYVRRLVRSRPSRDAPDSNGASGAADAVLLSSLGLGMLPILIAVFVIAPRNHYLQQFYVLASLAGAVSLGGLLTASARTHWLARSRVAFVGAVAVLLFVAPPAKEHQDRNAERAKALRERSAAFDAPPRIFTMFRGLGLYVDEDAEEIHFTFWPPDKSSLKRFLRAADIDLVFLDEPRIALQYEEVRAGLQAFVSSPESHGFEPLYSDDRMLTYSRSSP